MRLRIGIAFFFSFQQKIPLWAKKSISSFDEPRNGEPTKRSSRDGTGIRPLVIVSRFLWCSLPISSSAIDFLFLFHFVATSNGSNGTQPVPINDRPPSNSISTDFSHSNYSNNSCSIDSKSPQPPPDGVECDQAAAAVAVVAAVEVASKSVPAVVEAVPSGKDHIREPKLGKLAALFWDLSKSELTF